MGSNEDRAWVSLGGVDHVELREVFFRLTDAQIQMLTSDILLCNLYMEERLIFLHQQLGPDH